jgi:hypothetical protein
MNERKYETFDDWFNELEGFGMRSERFLDELVNIHPSRAIEWLQAAWECARMESEKQCWCYECNKDQKVEGVLGLTIPMTRMILCPECGNKRCPKATNHELACTNSNEPGQSGSRY